MDTKILFKVAGLAVLAGLLTWLPVQAGYDHAHETNTIFTGFDYGEDSQAYAAYVRSGVDGNPLFLKNNSTSEPQEGRYVVLYFTLLALVAKFTGAGIDLIWHLFRILAIFFLAWSVWRLGSELFAETRSRIVFVIIFLFGGGFGWTTIVLGGFFPALERLYSTDLVYFGYSVFSYLFHPLGVLAISLLIWETIFLSRWVTHTRSKDIALATLCVIAAFFNHPAASLVGGLLAGVVFLHVWLIPKNRNASFVWKHGKYLAAGGLLAIAYIFWARGDPVYLFHQAIYLTWERKEPFWIYPFSMGLPLLLGLYAMTRKLFLGPFFMILKVWFVIALLLSLFIPAGVKYLYLVYPALAGWAVLGLNRVVSKISSRLRASPRIVLAGMIILVCASVPFTVDRHSSDVREGSHFYLTPGEDAAVNWLATQTRGVVLSNQVAGQVFSWRTSQQPYLAHGFLTIDYERKQKELGTFLDTLTSSSEKEKWLLDQHITYIFYGPREHALGVIDAALPLVQVYSSDGVSIFRVIVS